MTHDKLSIIEPEAEDFFDPALQMNPNEGEEVREMEIGTPLHGKRLDMALSELLPEFTRSYLQRLLLDGQIQVLPTQSLFASEAPDAEKVYKPSSKVRAGMRVKVELKPTEQSLAFVPQDIPLEVLFEDEHLRVINKPAGLVVHPAPGNWSGTMLNGLLHMDPQAKFVPRAGIVHRLDKDTSGLMVVAKSRECMDKLVQMIAQRQVHREYLALVQGACPVGKRMEVYQAIGRDPRNRLRMAVVDLATQSGKSAHTSCFSLANHDQHALIYCQLHTGRTHQIRVHLAWQGFPLVGDTLYGGRAIASLSRQALHAFRLSLDHPFTGQHMSWSAPWPHDLQLASQELGLSYNLKNIPVDMILD